jgi:inositol-pentakisphosphate 2-kinase
MANNPELSVDEDDQTARLRIPIMAARMKDFPGHGSNDGGAHAYSGTGDVEGTDADYLNIEEELEKGYDVMRPLYAKIQPQVAERIDYHMKEVGFHFTYVAEGGANIVFKIELSGADKIPILPPLTRTKMLALQGMLLRVRKHVSSRTLNNRQIMEGYERRIKPMFRPNNLLQQKLIRLPKGSSQLLMRIVQVAERDGIRDPKRAKEVLVPQSDHYAPFSSPEDYGILIQDLSPRTPREHLIEFKPKWLTQSRSAPANAKRCRTCALREMRRAHGTPPGRGDSNFCPLDLLSSKAYILKAALRKLWTVCGSSDSDVEDTEWVNPITGEYRINPLNRFEREFRRKVQPLLGRLKALQGIHHHAGLNDFERATEDEVSLAMALRDCSVFLRVDVAQVGALKLIHHESSLDNIEILDVKLADLDLKSPEPENRAKWTKMERRLIEQGWYEGRMAPSVVTDEVICRLSRTCT